MKQYLPVLFFTLICLRLTAQNGSWQYFNSPAAVQSLAAKENTILAGTMGDGIVRFDTFSNRLWVTTNATVSVIQQDVWTHYYVNEDIGCGSNGTITPAVDGAGRIWVQNSCELSRFDGQIWTTLNADNSGLPSNKTRRIAFDKDGGMYVTYWPTVQGATGATVVVLRGGIWTELTPPGWENTANEAADAFIVDSQNRLWFAEFNGPGVYRYDPMLVSAGEPESKSARFSVFPNPSTNQVILKIPAASTGVARLRVSNAQGQLVYTSVITDTAGQTVDMSRWPSGVYLFTVFQGGGVSTVKVVRE